MGRRRTRILLLLVTLVIAALIVSTTLGREIFAGRRPGLTSFGIVHFAGYLFFLLMPVEALVPWYLAEGHAGMALVPLAVATALAAQAIDYGIGFLLSERVIEDLIGAERYARARRAVRRHGRWAILVFNLFPLSSPNLILAAGIARFGLGRALLYSLMGLTAKYLAIVWGVAWIGID